MRPDTYNDFFRLMPLLQPVAHALGGSGSYWPPTEDYMDRLLSFGDDLVTEIADEALVSKKLVAVTWWIFAQIMRIAEDMDDGEPARAAAWQWFDKLNTAYGSISVTG